jgi:uncharacterized protein (DUF3084 family)
MPSSAACSGVLKKKRESKAESAAAKAQQVNKRLHELQTLYWAELEYLHKEFTALEQKLIPEQEVRPRRHCFLIVRAGLFGLVLMLGL